MNYNNRIFTNTKNDVKFLFGYSFFKFSVVHRPHATDFKYQNSKCAEIYINVKGFSYNDFFSNLRSNSLHSKQNGFYQYSDKTVISFNSWA